MHEPEPESEPESEGKTEQPQAPVKAKTGVSFSGVPTGEEGDEMDKARRQLLLQSGGEKNIPKTLRWFIP